MGEVEFNSLDKIRNRMASKSPSEFAVGHSTKRTKITFEDACGALAYIKSECDNDVFYACSVYCDDDDRQSRFSVRFALHDYILRWLGGDNRSKERSIMLVDMVVDMVYTGKPVTYDERGAYLCMTKQSYAKVWHGYVSRLEGVLLGWLSEGNNKAGEYHYQEGKV